MKTSTLEQLKAYLGSIAQNLQLDLTRGRPCSEQLALSNDLLTITETLAENGTDCRNYGGLEGLPEARALFGHYLEVPADRVIIGGNSSLALMHDIIVQSLVRHFWTQSPTEEWVTGPKFICPVPGYDRHFAICAHYGINMIPVAMKADGPDMEAVAELVKQPSVVGMWCMPKYSNPTGVTYSDTVVTMLASMHTANPNFRLFWDNAYAVHDLTAKPQKLLSIWQQCQKRGNADRVYIFGSTSKITFASSGISAVAMSESNRQWYLKGLTCQTIGPDKINQLRHALFLRSMANIREHMQLHKKLLAPKFKTALRVLEQQLGGKGLATWTKPNGGYFISLDVQPGCAKRVVELAAEAGVKLTPAGATFPYGNDPQDSNIRIAPSFPSVSEIEKAMKVLCHCIEIAAAEKQN